MASIYSTCRFIFLVLWNNHLFAVTVRVVLDDLPFTQQRTWHCSTTKKTNSILLTHKKYTQQIMAPLQIVAAHGRIFINQKRLRSSHLLLKPQEGKISVNGKVYDGTLELLVHNERFLLINCVALEDYICSVIKTESWPGWPKEINRVFAIMCRSYALAKIIEANEKKIPYHIRNTNHHQTYQGVHDKALIKEAVQETKGLIVGYHGQPILAMFDSCCGGIIPAHVATIDFEKYPYLKREIPCTFCKAYKIFSWQARYPSHSFTNYLRTHGVQRIKKIERLNVIKDKAGIVRTIQLYTGKKVHDIEARTLYRIFKEVKSFCYNICLRSNAIHIEGVGFGHHMGLCQWGARQMVKEGWSCRDILQFYYPGTTLMRLAK